jgi:hypothetical protein
MKKLTLPGIFLAAFLAAVPACSPASKRAIHKAFLRPLCLEYVTEANRFLRNFPDEIPGIRSVDKYENPGAEICLVHIRNTHFVFNLDLLLELLKLQGTEKELTIQHLKEEYSQVNRVQKNVHRALSFLIEEYGLRQIRCEGITQSTREEDIQKNYSGVLEVLVMSGIFAKEKEAGDLESFRYIPGAEILLHLDGKLKLLSAVKAEIEDKALKDRALWYDPREDAFLDIAVGSREKVVSVLFGSRHAFGGRKSCGRAYSLVGRVSDKDNLAAYVKGNGLRFSLIELTPNRYRE